MLSLKHSLTDQFEYIFPEDDAVDRESPEFNEELYEEELDAKHLPLKPDGTPTKFYCKPLTREAVSQVYDMFGSGRNQEAAQLAVACGLKTVSGGPKGLDLRQDRRGGRLSSDSMDQLHAAFGVVVLNRLGGVIVRRSTLSPF